MYQTVVSLAVLLSKVLSLYVMACQIRMWHWIECLPYTNDVIMLMFLLSTFMETY